MSSSSPTPVIDQALAARSVVPPAQAQACAACHQEVFDEWLGSQHAHANRLIDETDRLAFAQQHAVVSGDVSIMANLADGDFQFEVSEPGGATSRVSAEAVIGVSPLIQYLVTAPDGSLQAISAAWDTVAQEWFDVAGEPRLPEDWGYWRNRGVTWNSRCAFCHMTTLVKGYDAATDSYQTTWSAMGVSCAQCHAGSEEHAQYPERRGLISTLNSDQIMDNCASCHARRDELTLEFEPGQHFDDHFRLVLPDDALAFHPDGQVADEDFEYGSLRLSRMGYRGITCLDCHDPHSGQLLAPVEDNSLCMTCHAAPGRREAVVIDAATHTHHPAESTGSLCVECHMPKNVYMVHDERRDHGFTTPDPQLTIELGIPNACNRCHEDETPLWASQHTEAWYGDRMERRSRHRARIVARAQQLDSAVVPQLLEAVREELIPAWRAAMTRLLVPWATEPDVEELLLQNLHDEEPLVRAAAAFALGGSSEAATRAVTALWTDERRVVRLDSIWATLGHIPLDPIARNELQRNLVADADQPAGALRAAQLALVEGRSNDAVAFMEKVVMWDRSSGEAHYMLGSVLHQVNRSEAALAAFEQAVRLRPEEAQYRYALALLYGELDRPDRAVEALEQVVRLESTFGRAWYNLGLGYAQLERLSQAAGALTTAAQLMTTSPHAEYALATVRLRQGQQEAARAAAARALAIDPDYGPARSLLEATR